MVAPELGLIAPVDLLVCTKPSIFKHYRTDTLLLKDHYYRWNAFKVFLIKSSCAIWKLTHTYRALLLSACTTVTPAYKDNGPPTFPVSRGLICNQLNSSMTTFNIAAMALPSAPLLSDRTGTASDASAIVIVNC